MCTLHEQHLDMISGVNVDDTGYEYFLRIYNHDTDECDLTEYPEHNVAKLIAFCRDNKDKNLELKSVTRHIKSGEEDETSIFSMY